MPTRLWIAPAVLVAALAAAWLDEDAGLRAWSRLHGDLEAAQSRTHELRGEITALQAEAEALADDAFAQEKAIRADLGLARPGETVVRMRPPGEEPLRRP